MQPAESASVPRAADGRVPGRRGLATRQRLLECTIEMLATTPYRDLKVTDITREAGTSPATFYQYFVDIETAVLSLAEQTADEGLALSTLIDGRPWRGGAGWQTASALVDGVMAFWLEHQAILRVVDLLTLEGDARFRQARVRMLNAVTRALATAIEDAGGEAEPAIEPAIEPMAMAGSLVSMLAHVAAHQAGFESWHIDLAETREAMTRLVYWGVTSPRLPRR